MRTLIAHLLRRSVQIALIGTCVAFGVPAPVRANVITDWDEKAIIAMIVIEKAPR